MSPVPAQQLHRWRPRWSWSTGLVAAGVVVVLASLGLSGARLAPMLVTTFLALLGGTAFVLGVSASVSAFFERDTYADSDFWR